MATVFVSSCCTAGYRFNGGTLPAICPQCKQPCLEWTAMAVENEPKEPYVLTEKDGIVLRVIGIDPELPPVIGTVES